MIKIWFEIPEVSVELELYELALQYSQPYTRIQRSDGRIITCSTATSRRPTDISVTIPKSSLIGFKSNTNLCRLLRTAVENHSTLLVFEYNFNSAYQIKLTEVAPALLGNPLHLPEYSDELFSFTAAVIATGYFTNYDQRTSFVTSEVY